MILPLKTSVFAAAENQTFRLFVVPNDFSSAFRMPFEIDITAPDQVNADTIEAALRHALQTEQVESAILSVSIVDNRTIHRLNQQHLQHDYPTDVISFQLEWTSDDRSEPPRTTSNRSAEARVEGEIVASWEYAQEMAERGRWSAENELTLYVVHGMLHICGYDDLSPAEKSVMRQRERTVLEGLGLFPVYPDDDNPVLPATDDSETQQEGHL